MDVPIIILAAGTSSRMRGADKLLHQVDGVPLIARQARVARASTAGPVIVALPTPPHPRYEALAGIDVQTLPVHDADEGMNASLRAGFAGLPTGTEAAMLILGDLPDITGDDIKAVMHAVDITSETLVWRGATSDGKPGHPVVFHHTLFPIIADQTGDSGGQAVIKAAKGRVALIPLPGHRARADLDTPEAWDQWRRDNPERA